MTKQFGERAGEGKLRRYFEGYTTIEYQKDMSRKYHGGLIGSWPSLYWLDSIYYTHNWKVT